MGAVLLTEKAEFTAAKMFLRPVLSSDSGRDVVGSMEETLAIWEHGFVVSNCGWPLPWGVLQMLLKNRPSRICCKFHCVNTV